MSVVIGRYLHIIRYFCTGIDRHISVCSRPDYHHTRGMKLRQHQMRMHSQTLKVLHFDSNTQKNIFKRHMILTNEKE